MVRTRSSSRGNPPLPASPEDGPRSDLDDEDLPQPVSSSDDDSSPPEQPKDIGARTTTSGIQALNTNHSRLFAPYRSIGVVSTGAPYHLETHADASFVTLPIHDRIHTLNARDRLQPVLVSQAVVPNSNKSTAITHVVSNASMRISLCAHSDTHMTLLARTRPIHSLRLLNHTRPKYTTVEMLDLGMCKASVTSGEKEGQLENALWVAVVMRRKNRPGNKDGDDSDGIPTFGEDHDDDDESVDGSTTRQDGSESSDDDDDDDDSDLYDSGQIVLLLATRTHVQVQKRIPLTTFMPAAAIHPATYLNKIVVGGSKLILLNLRSEKIIHEFQCLSTTMGIHETTATITALEQSPAVDTIAVGMSNGTVHLINLRHDKRLFGLHHYTSKSSSGSAVYITSLSFRTDGSAMRYNIAPLAVGRSDGTVSIWDLSADDSDEDIVKSGSRSQRTLLCEMEKVHPGGVAKLSYLPQEPLLLSTGTHSNSVLLHIFDNPDHSGRLLRQRKGHMSPPKHIRYLTKNSSLNANAMDGTDASSCQILSSGGLDRTLRVFSTARSVLDKTYSQGRGLEKRARTLGLKSVAELLLPPITGLATSEARRRDWGDLVTIHKHHAFAYVWSTKRGAQSGPVLRQPDWSISAMQQPPPRSTHATSIAISACGNYALVGTLGGTIYKYNVQSGIPRGSYPTTLKRSNKGKMRFAGDVNRTMIALEKKMKLSNRPSDRDKEERDAVQEAELARRRNAKLALASHTGASVTGLAVDSVNKTLLSVGTDAKLILWNFVTHAPHKKSPCKLPSPATMMYHVRDSDLAAIAMEDFSLVLFDCAALSIVRRFGVSVSPVRHTGPITDIGFSPDGRHLFSSSTDSTVRVWDVPSNSCVDWLSFDTPPTSLAVSPTGEFLATTHADKLGISLWSDRSFYQTVHLDGAHPPKEPTQMDDPAPVAEMSPGDDHDKVDVGSDLPLLLNVAATPDGDNETDDVSQAPVAKGQGLITLSGLPPAHWKNLFHLELVKERNKPMEAPKKPPSAPFFLQWRSGEPIGGAPESKQKQVAGGEGNGEDEEWAAAWSDDDDGVNMDKVTTASSSTKRVPIGDGTLGSTTKPKKRKLMHYRSHLAALLDECYTAGRAFGSVTEHLATLGPSAIDVSLSTLCNGMHDLDEGLPLLHKASLWLLEACRSGERYEAVNAYLHRFLYLHAAVLAGIKDPVQNSKGNQELTEEEQDEKERERAQRTELLEAISGLRQAQRVASDVLREKMQHSLCLLRHFSRMV